MTNYNYRVIDRSCGNCGHFALDRYDAPPMCELISCSDIPGYHRPDGVCDKFTRRKTTGRAAVVGTTDIVSPAYYFDSQLIALTTGENNDRDTD